nr:hypothetical protein [Marinobacter sp. ELB17]
MGLTQHTHGSVNVGMQVNLLVLRGNIGRHGAAEPDGDDFHQA